MGNYRDDVIPDRWGRVHCDICGARFKLPPVSAMLEEFLVCHTCIQAGPAAVATEAERIAGDKDRIMRRWEYTDSPRDRAETMQEDIESMASGYRSLAAGLRGLRSFEDLPGGKIALGVAEVLQASAGRRKRKAA